MGQPSVTAGPSHGSRLAACLLAGNTGEHRLGAPASAVGGMPPLPTRTHIPVDGPAFRVLAWPAFPDPPRDGEDATPTPEQIMRLRWYTSTAIPCSWWRWATQRTPGGAGGQDWHGGSQVLCGSRCMCVGHVRRLRSARTARACWGWEPGEGGGGREAAEAGRQRRPCTDAGLPSGLP